jgi:Rps23 Pro-64 3,4-dihydroxylase Tpa1-like proline 4-hydroxylase
MNRAKELAQLVVGRINHEADRARREWAAPAGTSTRHFTVDDLLPDEIAAEIYAAFPQQGQGFSFRESFRERKHTSAKLSDLPEILGAITYAIQDPAVVAAVAGLVDWDGIQPDPMLYAGGLSMMFRDAFLNPHIDNSHDAERSRYRRLNLLYYATPGWNLEDGGNLELWDDDGSKPLVIESRFNRLVVMETNKASLHSVSPVVAAGPRCCVSSYYFSEQSPDGTDYFHVTSFKGRPEEPLKRALGPLDNAVRQTVASAFKVGRGKKEMNV